MKKTISVLVIMSVILSFCVVNFASTNSSNVSESNVVLSISYSSNIIGITGMDGEGGEEDSAPESFFVTEDNHIYILDSINSQILRFYNNSLIETIKIDCAKSHMNDMIIVDMYIFILLSNNIILKVNHDGTIQEEIDVSSYLRTEEIITKDTSLQITVGPESILYEDNCLKLFCGDGKVYNLTNTEAPVEERNTGINSEGFTAIAFSTSNIAFPSFCTPIAANKAATIKDYTIYYTSEVYYSAGTTIFDRRLYYTASDKIVKYVQLEQAQFTKPYRQYQIMTDGTVYQMITTESQLKIIKLKFSTDYSSTPSYIVLSNETAAAQVTTGNTAGTPLDSIQYVSDPSTAIWRVQTSFNYEWTYNPATHGNKTLNGIPSGVVQPQFLAAISTPTLVEGIPYSYAGSRGKDVEYQTQYDTTFPQAVSLGKYTGNCTSSVSTQKTCGVDCSGYVSVCYLLGAKYSTYSLCGSGKPFYWISGDPQSGDIMNHPGDHVFILYYNFVLYGRMLYCIYECTTTAHYRTGNWNHIDKTCYGAFYVDNADLTGYAFARLNGW